MGKADDLREQAQALLKQAEAIDGKQLFVVALGGSDIEQPKASFLWHAVQPSEAVVCEQADIDVDAVSSGGIELAIRKVTLNELFSAPAPEPTIRRSRRP